MPSESSLASLEKNISDIANLSGDNLILFSLKDCEPCQVFKKFVPFILNKYSNTLRVFELSADGLEQQLQELPDNTAIKFFPTFRFIRGGQKIKDLKGALQASDDINLKRIDKWMSQFY